ncbi:MAG: deoxyribose-phosphate aldolase [Odoribacteraceae bacterium]|jgi:deoxyribose-phosphate aldolase|nr:deoxyribose-phosphate aldolase [Odoribacteraceae bacterium]
MTILNELKAYRHAFLEEMIEFELDGVIKKEAAAAHGRASFETCLSCMDYTSLETTDTVATVTAKIAAMQDKLKGNGLPGVASVCVYPRFAGPTRQSLSGTSIRTAVVAGGFPSAGTFAAVRELECRLAIEAGAEEIDVVIPAGEILEENYQQVYDELVATREICAGVTLKAIIETGELKEIQPIFRAALICAYAGADFVKSSTGKVPVGATPVAITAICEALRQFRARTGKRVGVKISGGVTRPDSAVAYMTIVRHNLGEEWIAPRYFRLGASRLLDELIRECKQYAGSRDK